VRSWLEIERSSWHEAILIGAGVRWQSETEPGLLALRPQWCMFLLMTGSDATKVFIKGPDGTYLSASGKQWAFTEHRNKATVFDYVRDRIAEQVEGIRKTHGITLLIVAVDPKEIHERCDGCDQLVAPAKAFFDGKQFFCGNCKDLHPGS
jgi:hypothetical protein